jgi:hypothetical protein
MTASVWVIGISALLVVGLTYILGDALGSIRGYTNGYAAGQLNERRTMTRAMNEARRRALAARRDVEHLYERARRQIGELS